MLSGGASILGSDMTCRRVLIYLSALAVLCGCAGINEEPAGPGVFGRPLPDYPKSELTRHREGWVIVHHAVGRSGLVEGADVFESSGNRAFEKAALDAVRRWRYEPGDARELNVLVNFVFDYPVVELSRKFVSRNAKVHALIDAGDLDGAQDAIERLRKDRNLSPYELAYSRLTEGRVAEARGDARGQLQAFRAAMIDDGRWLTRETYLSCLRAVVALEVDQGDYASAQRDYALLMDSPAGREKGVVLGETMQSVAQWLAATPEENPGLWVVADTTISVERERPPAVTEDRYPPRADDRAAAPPARSPATK